MIRRLSIVTAVFVVVGLFHAPAEAEDVPGIQTAAAAAAVGAVRMGIVSADGTPPSKADADPLNYSMAGCSAGRTGETHVTAKHCSPLVPDAEAWTTDPVADIMWRGPEPAWVTPYVGMEVHGTSWPQLGIFGGAVLVKWKGTITQLGARTFTVTSEQKFCEHGASGTLIRDANEDPVAVLDRKLDVYRCKADRPTSTTQ